MARLLESLELFAPEPVEAPRPGGRPAQGKRQLWLAACLPSLALECLTAPTPLPAVAVELERGQLQVAVANTAAAEAGIAAGTKLGTAMALAASLQVFERSPSRERECLESLAAWAGTLTSLVSIEAPDSLLLEVGGSLRLFGSLAAIKAALHGELKRRHRDFRLCVAPTATAALWLARAASADVVDRRRLAGSLAPLPLAVTRWPAEVQALLRELGLRTVGDCARLPRDGFARRVGREYLLDLDRAFGRAADLRSGFSAPRTWSSAAELAMESVDNAVLLEALEELVDELCAALERQHAEIGGFEIVFEHWHRSPTVESFALREPAADRALLLELIEDRLERVRLPVPAVAVRIRSGVFRPAAVRKDAGLFETKPLEERTEALLERLQERFGAASVYGLAAVAEHRPERAWAKRLGSERSSRRAAHRPAHQARPLWLLRRPVPIEARRESLELVSGPERIESGWWDEHDVERDYYTARNGHGQRLWVFRDRRTRAWFLHGLFG
jgi:protein ImuB